MIDSVTSTVFFVIQERRNGSSLDLAVHICQNAFSELEYGLWWSDRRRSILSIGKLISDLSRFRKCVSEELTHPGKERHPPGEVVGSWLFVVVQRITHEVELVHKVINFRLFFEEGQWNPLPLQYASSIPSAGRVFCTSSFTLTWNL